MRKVFHSKSKGSASGFTLIELLISLGIIIALTAIALPAILHARKVGIQTRVRSDLGLISTALEAYRADFNGDYPRFTTASDDYGARNNIGAAYPWLDYKNYRGAVLLCRALIGPGPGPLAAGGATPPTEVVGEDGADGPGFRTRRLLSQINGVWTTTGKVYGPYLDASKFKLIKFQTSDQDGLQMIADSSGNPILYYPASTAPPVPPNTLGLPGSKNGNLYYDDPQNFDASTSPYQLVERFNGFDNQAYLDSLAGTGKYSDNSSFAQLAMNSGSLPYLLWTAGIDGKFGLVQGKTDDIANFDLPNAK